MLQMLSFLPAGYQELALGGIRPDYRGNHVDVEFVYFYPG